MATTLVTAAERTELECLRAAGLVLLGVAAAVVLIWAGSFPGWPLAAGVVLSALVVASLLLIAGAEPPAAARWLRPAGVVAALAVAVGGGIAVERSAEAPLVARFAQSRAAFDAAVEAVAPVPDEVTDHWLPFPGQCPARLGSYRIGECHAFAGGYMFLQDRNAWGDDAGFAYAPHGLPASEGGRGVVPNGFTHLDGPWYAWSCSC